MGHRARLPRPLSVIVAIAIGLALSACNQGAPPSTSTAAVNTTAPPGADPTTTSSSIPVSTTKSHVTTTSSIPLVNVGGTIAYEVRSVRRSSDLFTVNPDGSERREVGATGYLAAWSPDGSQLAFLRSGNGGRNDLYVINADGTNERRLTDTPEEEGIPAWSPKGDTLAVSIPTDGDAEIFLLDAVTGQIVVQLTDNEGINDYMPAWSPDGSHIVYTAGMGVEGSDEIHVMSADGTGSIQLTDNAFDDYYPAWAPDGATIAFVSSRVGEQTLFLMDVDGSSQRQLTDGMDRDSRPAWSPDGSTIAYHSFVDDSWSIELIDVVSGAVTVLTEDGVHPAWSR